MRLAEAAEELLAYLDNPADEAVPATGFSEIRDRGRALLAQLARYRQDSSDLLHEADAADLGGEG